MRTSTQTYVLLKAAIKTILQNHIILYPAIVLALLQLFTLETLYFAPRPPLLYFFGPLISHVWSEDFLHYPMDLLLLPKLFYYGQMIIYLFLGNFLMAITSFLVAFLNNHHRVHLKNAVWQAGRMYVHLFCSSLIGLILFQCCSAAYTLIVRSVLKINMDNLPLSAAQKIFLWATPYVQFFLGIIVTTMLVYVVPAIVLDQKKIVSALRINFQMLLKSFPTSFFIVLIPTLFYLPVLAARNNVEWLVEATLPEIQIFIIILGIFITVGIDLIIMASITTHYLHLKEQ